MVVWYPTNLPSRKNPPHVWCKRILGKFAMCLRSSNIVLPKPLDHTLLTSLSPSEPHSTSSAPTHPPAHPQQICLQPWHWNTYQLIHFLPHHLIPTNGLMGLHNARFVMTKCQTTLLKIVCMCIVNIQAGLGIELNVWHVDTSELIVTSSC